LIVTNLVTAFFASLLDPDVRSFFASAADQRLQMLRVTRALNLVDVAVTGAATQSDVDGGRL
jgi:hypothetical protein